ncbi:MAG: hypothetical protein E7633_04950 [Ruminococcaceae bacterium]|nr:hypothetical protein [Oscillospiraceae bacterium]
MKKRLIAAILCLVMLVGVFAGCNDSYVASSTSAKAMTVVIALVSDEKPTEEARLAVEDALSTITKQLYSIEVRLDIYTPDEYRVAITNKLEAREEDYYDTSIDYTSIADNDSYEKNEFGRDEVKYPDTYPNQVDILLVNDALMLREFAANGWLYELEGEDCMASQDGEGTLISKHIPEALRQIGMIDEFLYAIPGNSVYENYQYLLVDKKLYSTWGTTTADEITGLDSINDYLVNLAKNESGIIPLYNVTNMGVTNLAGDGDTVVGQYISEVDQEKLYTSTFLPTSILGLPEVKAQISTICNLRAAGGAMPKHTYDVDFSEKFGACYVTGTAALVEQYEEDYYVIPVYKPHTTTESVYNSMFSVSTYSSDPTRAFKVLSLLYTNSQFVNTLLYGVVNQHYTLDSVSGMVNKIEGSGYSMNRYGVGNVFLTKQSTDMTAEELELSANGWKHAKTALSQLIVTPYLGFEVEYNEISDYENNAESKYLVKDIENNLEMLYEELLIKIEGYADLIDETTGKQIAFNTFYDGLTKWLSGNDYVWAAIDVSDEATYSFRIQYEIWYDLMNPVEEE